MANISDVADRAGVSPATVSRVLSGQRHVADATRARVLEAADALGYTPSRAAQALAKGRSQSIGVVAPLASSPSVTERLHGLASRLSPTSYDLTLFDISSAPERDALMEELASPERVGAIVMISLTVTEDEAAMFQQANVPLVIIDANVPKVDCVYIDDAEGGRIAARNLLASGHRRIAFIGDTEDHPLGFTSSHQRRIAFEDVLTTASIEVPPSYLKLGPHGFNYAREATGELLALERPPTAIFAASDVQALGVIEAAREAGVDVPRELSVIGFDDIQAARAVGLSTVRQPLEESGAYGAKLVLEAIEHAPMGMAIELPLSLVSRRTTGPPPATTH